MKYHLYQLVHIVDIILEQHMVICNQMAELFQLSYYRKSVHHFNLKK